MRRWKTSGWPSGPSQIDSAFAKFAAMASKRVRWAIMPPTEMSRAPYMRVQLL